MHYQDVFDVWYAAEFPVKHELALRHNQSACQHKVDSQKCWEAGFGAARASKTSTESKEFPGLTEAQVGAVRKVYRDTHNLISAIKELRDLVPMDLQTAAYAVVFGPDEVRLIMALLR